MKTILQTIDDNALSDVTGGRNGRWLAHHPRIAAGYFATHPFAEARFDANHPRAGRRIDRIQGRRWGI